jgi:hypothetical protein
MPITLHHERDNIYRVEISGTLRKAEFDRTQDALADAMQTAGRVKLLFVLSDFAGWETNSSWSDLSFYIRHGDDIERIAIVGDERWRSEALMFAAADLRRAPVEFFSSDDAVADARKWLAAG